MQGGPLRLKILNAESKTWESQRNTFFFFFQNKTREIFACNNPA